MTANSLDTIFEIDRKVRDLSTGDVFIHEECRDSVWMVTRIECVGGRCDGQEDTYMEVCARVVFSKCDEVVHELSHIRHYRKISYIFVEDERVLIL